MFGRKQKRIEQLESRCARLERSCDELSNAHIKEISKLQAYQRAVAVAAHDLYGFGDIRIQRILDKAAQVISYEEHVCAGDDVHRTIIALADDMKDMLEERELTLTFKQL